MKAIVEAWGYGEKSSGGQQTIAALRQFGLLDGRGQSLQLVAIDADGINGRDCRTAPSSESGPVLICRAGCPILLQNRTAPSGLSSQKL